MTPEMEAAAWEGLATNGPAQQHAEGSDAVARWLVEHDQVVITRERLAGLERLAALPSAAPDKRNDAGLLAFIVRDLMAAAGYHYQPDRRLTDQARMCGQLIENTRSELEHEIADRKEAFAQRAAETQRLTDLVTELRKQLASALKLAREHGAQIEPWDYPEPAAARSDTASWAEYRREAALEDPAIGRWREVGATIPTPAEWNALVYERDGLRKIVMDKDQELEELQRDPNIARSPDGLIWIKNSDGWCIFTPNGEYCQSEFGDELTDAQVADWPKGRLPDRVPPAVLGDIEVTRHD